MQGHANLVLVRNWHDPIEEISDPFPQVIGCNVPCQLLEVGYLIVGRRMNFRFTDHRCPVPYCHQRTVFHLADTPPMVEAVTPTWDDCTSQDRHQRQVVFQSWNACGRAILEKRLERLDFLIAALATENDIRWLATRTHEPGTCHVNTETVFLAKYTQCNQFFNCGI